MTITATTPVPAFPPWPGQAVALASNFGTRPVKRVRHQVLNTPMGTPLTFQFYGPLIGPGATGYTINIDMGPRSEENIQSLYVDCRCVPVSGSQSIWFLKITFPEQTLYVAGWTSGWYSVQTNSETFTVEIMPSTFAAGVNNLLAAGIVTIITTNYPVPGATPVQPPCLIAADTVIPTAAGSLVFAYQLQLTNAANYNIPFPTPPPIGQMTITSMDFSYYQTAGQAVAGLFGLTWGVVASQTLFLGLSVPANTAYTQKLLSVSGLQMTGVGNVFLTPSGIAPTSGAANLIWTIGYTWTSVLDRFV
jgi:hypothetical protein